MNATMISAIVRHLLTGVAGAYAVQYGIDGGTMDAIVGGVAAAAGVGWSLLDKRKN